ncbi:MAG: hypothetical protein TEF_05405 [Rhizobiales bacterium NRL2]|jgi:Fe-S-cluster-containing dehydrogenase component/CRP-like cAMP-binding protein|nr:MAG: hypothetical protein TEF_05405 [Rhizobiales bacterium NRL2]
MVTAVETMARPQRWATPFGPDMTEAVVDELMTFPIFRDIDEDRFPGNTPLRGILLNDTRVTTYQPGEIVVREGDYGNSAFLILDGHLRVVLNPNLPQNMLGRLSVKKKGFFEALGQLWTNNWRPEVRDPERYQNTQAASASGAMAGVYLQDIPAILDEHQTAQLGPEMIFGELAALGRVPRTASIFAETEARVLEIRWQGLRELRRFDTTWKEKIDLAYRRNALHNALKEAPMFRHLTGEQLKAVEDATLFETHGAFDWHTSYKRMLAQGREMEHGTPIAREGDYPDGILMVRAGFARVSARIGNGERTLTYLGAGDVYGLEELYRAWKDKDDSIVLETSLTALGYLDILRIPRQVLEEFVFKEMDPPQTKLRHLAGNEISADALKEWAVGRRFINGTRAMLIDLNRCTRCDDCVRACAATHGGNPRFIRHGATFDHWMVANACMHCADPVCMIGCPTGAIHRSISDGSVVVNDDTCIGCGTCAASCPYDNIRLVQVANQRGEPLVDGEHKPIMKATKCDFCSSNPGGPACQRACPHDALRRVDFRGPDPFRGGYQ